MKQRFLGILLSFALMLTMMPVLGLSQEAYADDVTNYDLWVGNKQVTSKNMGNVLGDGTVSFTPANGDTPATLTLDGADISGEHINNEKHKSAAIYYDDADNDLIINATSASTVTGPNSSYDCYAIYSKGNLTVKGSLTVNGGGTSGGFSYGVQSEKELAVDGTLNVNEDNTNVNFGVTAWGIVVNKNGKLNVKGIDGIINFDGGIVVEGKLDATSTSTRQDDGTAIRISGGDGITVKEGAELIANGSEYGIYARDYSITINESAKLSANGYENAITGTVKNAIVGTGWDNAKGTGEGTKIEVKQEQTLGYKKVVFPPLPVDAVKYMIAALPADPTTEDDRASVKAAREAYDVLSDAEKDEIKYTLLKKLETAEETIRQADLDAAKSTAKTDLANYRNAKADSDYDADGVAAMNDAKTAGDTAIDKARDKEGVSEALANAKSAIDAVKTKSPVKPSIDPATPSTVHGVPSSIAKYVVTTTNTVSLIKAPNRKSFTVPATVVISGKKFNVTGIQAGAFKGTKCKTLTVKTKKLTKASVKGSLKGSKIKTVKVKVGKKKTNKKYVKKYKKIFTKKNCGKKVLVK